MLHFMKATNCLAVSFKEDSIDKPQVYKTSFNCNKARTKTEQAICHSKILADADIELSKLYYQLVNKQPPHFATQQKNWLRERDYCSYSLDMEHCLLKKHQERISQLKQMKIAAPLKNSQEKPHKTVNHTVSSVLQKYNISLYNVSSSKDNTCPTFHVKLKYYPLGLKKELYKKVYAELLAANSSNPYTLVDKNYNFKVNVGYRDKAKTIQITRSGEVSSPSVCLDGSRNPDAEQYTVPVRMKRQILSSPFNTPLSHAGRTLIAYLYAVDEKIIPYEYTGCTTGIKLRPKAKTGHYYIYLYDEITDYFYPNRIPVFKDDKPAIMGIEGAYFFTEKSEKSENLIVSQHDTCQESFYEIYGLWDDETSLQKLKSFHHSSLMQLATQNKA